MSITRRITTTAAVVLSLAAAGAPTAAARPVVDYPDAPAPTAGPPATGGGAAGQAAALRSLSQEQRQRVIAISALSDKQLAAGYGIAPPVANRPTATPAAVRVQAPQNSFDWGDAGIGAAGGLALAMLGLGGGFAVYRRRAGQSTAVPN